MYDLAAVMQVCKPKDFAMQINLHMENCWGIVRAVIDLCLKLDDGKYIIVKEPNKPVMRLYSVPENAFEQVGPVNAHLSLSCHIQATCTADDCLHMTSSLQHQHTRLQQQIGPPLASGIQRQSMPA